MVSVRFFVGFQGELERVDGCHALLSNPLSALASEMFSVVFPGPIRIVADCQGLSCHPSMAYSAAQSRHGF
jgi:hypothetical protein